MTIVVALLLPGVVFLGFWQLDRGAQKRALETAYLTQLTALPVRAADMQASSAFQRVKLSGEFLPQAFLVDNQVAAGVTGYWLLQGFADVSGRRLLVNRGFLAAATRRDLLPTFSVPPGRVTLIGTVWPFTGLIPVLDDDIWPESWPKRVQRLDVARMAQTLDAEAFEVRLEPGQPGVEHAAPFAKVLSDATHMGYAATWFGLAFALAIGYVAFGLKQGSNSGRVATSGPTNEQHEIRRTKP